MGNRHNSMRRFVCSNLFSSTTWTNLGKIRNKGFELTISSRNINHKNFQWTTDLVFSTNRLMVIDVGGERIDV